MTEPRKSPRVRPVAAGLAIVVTVALAAVAAMLLISGRGPATPGRGLATPGASAATASVDATPSASPTPTAQQGPVTIRWFIGLGPGGQPWEMKGEEAFIKRFNESQREIVLEAQFGVMSPEDELRNAMESSEPPDIVGPVDFRALGYLDGKLLDLHDQIALHGLDLGRYDESIVDLLRWGDQGQVGLPYLTYPAFVFYNRDIFARAGLPDLPTRVGQTYMGKTWDWEALGEVAAQLTLDGGGRKSTDPKFDSADIAQWGIDFQWWDGRRMASSFGGGSFVAEDGKTARIPDVWADAWNWYYQAMWTDHTAPTGPQIAGKLLNEGTTVSSGRIAMDVTNTWTINSFDGTGKPAFKGWDMAVMPAWNGVTSAPVDIDAFTVLKSSTHPNQAFEVMAAIMADPELMAVYAGGGYAVPGVRTMRPASLARYDAQQAPAFPGNKVTWSVLDEMLAHPASPSHDASMPNFAAAIADYTAFFTRLQATPGLDLDAELAALRARLQADFDAVPSP